MIRESGIRRESSTLILRDRVSFLKTSTVNRERLGDSLELNRARHDQSSFGIGKGI